MRFAGIGLAAAIHLATSNPAKLFGIAESYGRLQPGAAADLLLFRWDEDAKQIEVAATVAAGTVVYLAAG